MVPAGWLARAANGRQNVVPSAAAMAARAAGVRAMRGAFVVMPPDSSEGGSCGRVACMFRYARKSRLSWRQMVINGSEVGFVFMLFMFIVCVFVNKGGNWPRMGGRFAAFRWCI